MTKSKSQMDQEIIESADDSNNSISEVRVRHSDSVHPLDCECLLCKPLRFHEGVDETVIKKELDWPT